MEHTLVIEAPKSYPYPVIDFFTSTSKIHSDKKPKMSKANRVALRKKRKAERKNKKNSR